MADPKSDSKKTTPQSTSSSGKDSGTGNADKDRRVPPGETTTHGGEHDPGGGKVD